MVACSARGVFPWRESAYGPVERIFLTWTSYCVCLPLTFVTTHASILPDSVRAQHWQLCHLTCKRKRQWEEVAGLVYLDRKVRAGHAWAAYKWRPRLAANVQLNKLPMFRYSPASYVYSNCWLLAFQWERSRLFSAQLGSLEIQGGKRCGCMVGREATHNEK